MRGDLAKIDGITDIKTDTAKQVCSFVVTKPDLDYKAKLDEFAKTNSHLEDYSVM